MFWAAHYTRVAMGSYLKLSRWAMVEWSRRRRMRWPGLLPLLFGEWWGVQLDMPVLHLRENNLGFMKGKPPLMIQVQEDMQVIKAQ